MRIVALGGLGEIGMNCLVVEQAGAALVVDCGITFPEEDLGTDTFHPDFSYLESRSGSVAGVFLTHGHEDHVGGLPYLLRRMNVPVWGPPHAIAVAKHRLSDQGISLDRVRLTVVNPGERHRVGPFEVEPIRVAHSVVDATALAIRTAAGTLVHTGDFKFDPGARDSEATDEARLAQIGDEGVSLLLSDSTNIDAHPDARSETVVGETLAGILEQAERRVVLGMFASNLHRVRMIGDLCMALGRKIALLGRSLELSVQWGHELGRLDWPADLLVSRDQAAQVDPSRLVVLAGGTQAEPRSSLAQLAAGTHPSLRLDAGDTAVFSSRIIPGNDRAVARMMDNLLRSGVIVRNWITDPTIHVSGHAHREEQAKMLDLLRPRAFVPVHGTLHHLIRHAGLARERGVADVLVVENGEVVSWSHGRALQKVDRIKSGRIATWAGLDLPEAVLQQRRALGRGGTVHITVVLDPRGRLASRPAISSHGVVADEEHAALARSVALDVAKALDSLLQGGTRAQSDDAIADTARFAARRAVHARTGRKPVCSATVVRL